MRGGESFDSNTITGNKFRGLIVSGWCRDSLLAVNAVTANTPVNVNTRAAVRLVTVSNG